MSSNVLSLIRGGVLVGALGAWFLATTVKQEPTHKFKKLEGLEVAGLFLPEWRFFAPNPGVNDTHLLYRDRRKSGELTPWKEACPSGPRKILHMFWYPDRRTEKVIFDAMSELQNLLQDNRLERKEDIQVTVAYLTILNFVTYSKDHHEDAAGTQFLIARSKGHDESDDPIMVLLSNLHPLE